MPDKTERTRCATLVRSVVATLALSFSPGPAQAEVQSAGNGNGAQLPGADALASLKANLRPIDFQRVSVDPGLTDRYFRGYGLDLAPGGHTFGTFDSSGYTLAAHAFRPPAPRATVILMHGYLDHAGSHATTIAHLLARGYAVAAYDQPGHGLSSGQRASIGDFQDYTRIFRDFLALCRTHMPRPCHVLAHSTGASVVIDYLLSGKGDDLGQVVLVSPLVHSAQWGTSTTLAPLLEPFVDNVPRVFRDNTSDKRYAEFLRRDPLQHRSTSLEWFDALVEWNRRIESYPLNPRPVAIVQGDQDSVVDWRYNLAFLRTRFPMARVEMIAGGRHQLLNEAPAMRAEVLRIVDDELNVVTPPGPPRRVPDPPRR